MLIFWRDEDTEIPEKRKPSEQEWELTMNSTHKKAPDHIAGSRTHLYVKLQINYDVISYVMESIQRLIPFSHMKKFS